jgi:hypothetical protein
LDLIAIEEEGFTLLPGAVGREERTLLLGSIRRYCPGGAVNQTHWRERRGALYAVRNLLWDRSGFCALLSKAGLDRLAREALGSGALPISATFFDKNPLSNWKVPAHQDVVMPVEVFVDDPSFSRWTSKLGVVHVEPPGETLERLVALRLHFDDCPVTNGPLEMVPGSHRRGKLPEALIAGIDLEDFVPCPALAGDVLFMKPLLVHRSSPATEPGHRRVLQVVYATGEPGEGVRWRRPA